LEHINEYDIPSVRAIELLWGEGFLAPGGEGNVDNMVRGLDLKGKKILDIGCGQGRPACILAEKYGAYVVGIDLESQLIERSILRAERMGLSKQTEFQTVTAGALSLEDESFDIIISSGAFTQIEDKISMYKECLRVLRPGGVLSCYDWMKSEGEYSSDMLYWFELEGLTYAMETKAKHKELFTEAGFISSTITDSSPWYRKRVKQEYEEISSLYYKQLIEIMGQNDGDKFVENWRLTMLVCDKQEMLQVYSRAIK
jgi:ubiquinone/menaquinone biosynthesis C-methylase UbiE